MVDITDKKNLESVFAQDFGSPYFPVLADLYLKEGDFRRAKLVCEVGLGHCSENDYGKFIMAKIALAEEKLTVAEKWLKQVVKSNSANFNALRMLIRLEFALNRSPKTIKKYIQSILNFLPKDVECQKWLISILDSTDKPPEAKERITLKNNDNPILTVAPEIKSSNSTEDIDYDLEQSMATFTMLQVLKAQKHYQQALAVLKILESKNMDADRISKERREILSLLSQNSIT